MTVEKLWQELLVALAALDDWEASTNPNTRYARSDNPEWGAEAAFWHWAKAAGCYRDVGEAIAATLEQIDDWDDKERKDAYKLEAAFLRSKRNGLKFLRHYARSLRAGADEETARAMAALACPPDSDPFLHLPKD